MKYNVKKTHTDMEKNLVNRGKPSELRTILNLDTSRNQGLVTYVLNCNIYIYLTVVG